MKATETKSTCRLCEYWMGRPEDDTAYCVIRKANKAGNDSCSSFRRWVP